MKARFAAIVLAMLGVTFAQTGQPPKQDSLLERARKGDDSALLQMEQSGDIKDLQSLLRDPDHARKGSARFFLARMGDREALQYYACRSLTEDLSHIDILNAARGGPHRRGFHN